MYVCVINSNDNCAGFLDLRYFLLLKKQDCKIIKKVNSINNHPLAPHIPSKKVCSYNLRKKQCPRPKSNTERLMFAFVNRLIFKHNLSPGFCDYFIYFTLFYGIHKQLYIT